MWAIWWCIAAWMCLLISHWHGPFNEAYVVDAHNNIGVGDSTGCKIVEYDKIGGKLV